MPESAITTAPAALDACPDAERRLPARAVNCPGRCAFAAITAIFVVFMAASSAPSPLYVVYQQQWGFSATTLTVIFAVYVFGLIGSLLVLGALSDYVGRRPVLAQPLRWRLVALVLFITAGNVTGPADRPPAAGHRHRCGDDHARRDPG